MRTIQLVTDGEQKCSLPRKTKKKDYYRLLNSVLAFDNKGNEVENPKVVGKKNKTITSAELNVIQERSKQSGDAGVLEFSDLLPKEKVLYIRSNPKFKNFDVQYNDKTKKFEFTVKDDKHFLFFKSKHTAGKIKSLFGLKDGALYNSNKDLFDPDSPTRLERIDTGHCERDAAIFSKGIKFSLNVDDINL